LHKNDELISDVMKKIAHQWRQPLSQINSNVFALDDILYELDIKDTRLQERLKEIETLTEYMSKTIDDFKYKSLLSANFKIQTVLDEIYKNVAMNMSDNMINFSTNVDVNFSCRGNERELLQVIMILVNNAKDALVERNVFMPKIEIFAKEEESVIRIEIIDNAGGITKKNMERIFDYDYSTKHLSEGSGMGLSMAKKIIVEKFFGDLSVKNLGEGSCFHLSFNS
jgi:signal transduction histidine kinase